MDREINEVQALHLKSSNIPSETRETPQIMRKIDFLVGESRRNFNWDGIFFSLLTWNACFASIIALEILLKLDENFEPTYLEIFRSEFDQVNFIGCAFEGAVGITPQVGPKNFSSNTGSKTISWVQRRIQI